MSSIVNQENDLLIEGVRVVWKKIKIALWLIAAVFIVFQMGVYWIKDMSNYTLIYDWITYAVNYAIAIILFVAVINLRYLKWLQWLAGLIILICNTVFIYQMGGANLVVSKSRNQKHEVILKEYKKLKVETVQLQRRDLIFGRKMDALIGSSTYKTIEEKTYTINWIGGNTAVVTYKTSGHGPLEQKFVNFSWNSQMGYHNVGASLTGKWVEKDNSGSYFLYDKGEITYVKDGQTYHYRDGGDTKQLGIYAIKLLGDKKKPTFTVVLNSDSEIGQSGLINKNGTITICPVSFKGSDFKVYSKVK